MTKILACPNCGPKQNLTQLRCERCGRELAFVDWVGVIDSGADGEPRLRDGGSSADRDSDRNDERPAGSVFGRPGFTLLLAASVVVLVGSTVLLWPRSGPGQVDPASGARNALQMAAEPDAPSGVADSETRAAAEPSPAAESHRPGDLQQVLDRCRAALAERPADATLLDNVGQILVAMNRSSEAVPYLRQAVEIEPFNVTARFDLAAAYARSGQLKEAVDEYGQLVQAGTSDPRVYHNLALALRQLARNAEAATAFELATALAPDQSSSWLGLALSLEADARRSEAASALERVLTLEPDRPDADSIRARIARLRSVAVQSLPLPPDGGTQGSRQGQ